MINSDDKLFALCVEEYDKRGEINPRIVYLHAPDIAAARMKVWTSRFAFKRTKVVGLAEAIGKEPDIESNQIKIYGGL